MTTSNVPKRTYSPREVAEALGISLDWAWQLIRRDEIPGAFQLTRSRGARWFVPVAALDAFLEARGIEQQEPDPSGDEVSARRRGKSAAPADTGAATETYRVTGTQA